jgi:DNA-binding transcriptional LysR family regulator
MMDRLLEWRLFVTAATLRSFAATARSLGRSPQSVTRAIADLERRLQTRLLHRTTRSVSLTSEGARYLERGRQLLGEFDELESPSGAQALRGTLTVTAPVMFGQLHVLPVVAKFLALHPAVDVRLMLLDRVVSLAEESVDLGVRIGPLPDSALRARLVGSVHAVTCASPAYLARAGRPKTLDALAKHDCIAFSATTPIADRWSFAAAGRRERSISVHPRLTVNTTQAAIDAALAGLGVVRLLSYQVERLLAERKLVTVLDAHRGPPSPVHIVQLPGVPLRASATFSDFATAALGRRLHAKRR